MLGEGSFGVVVGSALFKCNGFYFFIWSGILVEGSLGGAYISVFEYNYLYCISFSSLGSIFTLFHALLL